MRIVISEDTNKFYRAELLSIDSSMEIISLNPEDSNNPSWERVPESDAFLCHTNSYLLLEILQKFSIPF
jgi:hypothetical protein